MNTKKTPKEIVKELDKYIIGQENAKKAVAIAVYNRYRRSQLSEKEQQEISPKNLMMIGPTGVGKTEIARRMAKIVESPFVKVEATKFTEVGYVGRDVESMIRDLVDVAVTMEEKKEYKTVRADAAREADKILLKILVPGKKKEQSNNANADFMSMMSQLTNNNDMFNNNDSDNEEVDSEIQEKRLDMKEKLDRGELDNDEITIQVDDTSKVSPVNDMMGQMGIDMNDMVSAMTPTKKVSRTLKVKDAREVLIKQESDKIIDHDKVYQKAIVNAENNGIVFIDEFDKIAKGNKNSSGEVSREGVQRDILPIIEGSQVNTKYGTVSTDHMLFIAAGAFSESKPSDLIAELQGRFPIRVELDDLSENDFVRILIEPDNSLIKQYIALIGTDGVKVTFTKEAIAEIAHIAYQVNHENENIGARRLATVLEQLLEEILYEAPDMNMGEITITQQYVKDRVGKIVNDKDLSKYIL